MKISGGRGSDRYCHYCDCVSEQSAGHVQFSDDDLFAQALGEQTAIPAEGEAAIEELRNVAPAQLRNERCG
jgi:hypothetical protein